MKVGATWRAVARALLVLAVNQPLLVVAQVGYSSGTANASHLQYLGSKCRSLHDGLRTAQTRGISRETYRAMQQDYRDNCADEESLAMQRAQNERSGQRKRQFEETRAERMEREREEQRAALHVQQCRESRRILDTKRARTDLTPGEKTDLARFEENFRSRCL